MATFQCGGERLPLVFGNEFLARLQVAVHQRFGPKGDGGDGFFLTGTVRGSAAADASDSADEAERTVSYWVPPGLPLIFGYDVRGDDGQRLPPVTVDTGEVGDLLAEMDRPSGVRCTDDLWLPFTTE